MYDDNIRLQNAEINRKKCKTNHSDRVIMRKRVCRFKARMISITCVCLQDARHLFVEGIGTLFVVTDSITVELSFDSIGI